MPIHLLAWLAIGLVTAAILIVSITLAAAPLAPVTDLGLRGWRRQDALLKYPTLRAIDPLVRWIAGFYRRLPLAKLRFSMQRELMYAGDFMGFDADAWLAFMTIGTLGTAAACALAKMSSPILPDWTVLAGALFGFFITYSAVGDEQVKRRRSINRNLPAAIDILALCLSAGMTFPQAMREYVERATNQSDPLIEELRQVLRQISLGHGYSYALEMLEHRVPVDSVRDFVGAVAQSEAKGTPLAQVLATQAKIARMQRSVLAEEAAARAGSMMVIPLSLVFITILVVIGGPLFLRGVSL